MSYTRRVFEKVIDQRLR